MKRLARGIGLSAACVSLGASAVVTPSPSPEVAASPPLRMRVLARVAGHVITDRQVQIDALLENSDLYAPGARAKYITKEAFDQSFQRVLAQTMATEENRILGQSQASESEVEESIGAARKSMGSNWKKFLSDFDLTEADLKPIFVEKIILRKGLAGRVKSATVKKDTTTQTLSREERAQASIDEWLKQLRQRYRVQFFKEDPDAPAR